MNRLRNRLILIFLAATLAPLAATIWLTVALLEGSFNFSATGDLDALSQSLEQVGHEFYQIKSDVLKQQAAAGIEEVEVGVTICLEIIHGGLAKQLRLFRASLEGE